MVRDKEYETATVLNGLPPMSSPLTVAETAGRTDQRRRVGQFVVMLSAIVGAVIIWIVSATMIVPGLYRARVIGGTPPPGGMRTETMQLSCLSPQQAADIIEPYIRESGSLYWIPSGGISAITVRATPSELAKSRDLIANFEGDPNAACRATATRLRNTLENMDRAFKDANSDPVLAPAPPTGKGPDLSGPTTGPTAVTPYKATTPPKKE
jgi:hypothetical protein